MNISMDSSELRKLTADLREAGPVAEKELRGVITKGAMNVKDQLRREMSRSASFGSITRFISFDLTTGAGVIEAEIGPEARGAGYLENIAYFGTSRGGGTVPDPRGAMNKEAPNLEKYLSKLAAGLL